MAAYCSVTFTFRPPTSLHGPISSDVKIRSVRCGSWAGGLCLSVLLDSDDGERAEKSKRGSCKRAA